MHDIIIGLGEVGKSLYDVISSRKDDVLGVDRDYEIGPDQFVPQGVMHVCIPYSDKFSDIVDVYWHKYAPMYTIIHSTVPVGTSSKLHALHSPVRGIHPNLTEGLLTFKKFLGGPSNREIVDHMRRIGFNIVVVDKAETTELGKLLDTEYYRACIEFCQRSKILSDKHDVPFSEAYTLFNETYNEGYTKLDHPEFVRPVLQPILGEIGGHCVIPNKILINK